MKQAKLLAHQYIPSETLELQGSRKKINPYLKKGYKIQDERNGFWVLTKSAKAIFFVENEDGENAALDLKYAILDYYNGKKISEKRVKNFAKAIDDGKVKVFYEDGQYAIK